MALTHIKNLFITSKSDSKNESTNPTNVDGYSKQEAETFQQWGHRMAGLAQGNASSLDPHLQVVCQTIKKEQENNAELQEQIQAETNRKIAGLKTDMQQEMNNEQSSSNKIADLKEKISVTTTKIANLTSQVKRVNAEAKANFIIGLCILVPLTIYLFVFYSSTAYSAFYKQIDYNQDLGQHMFDANALGNAWNQSPTCFLFILLMTFIFMALGYILHQISSVKTDRLKVLKSAGIIVVTFVFDTLLAYQITKKMYDAESQTMLESRPEYQFGMAFSDPSFWIVICCGFLAYIIWGLMFGFVMSSYNKLDLNKVEKDKLQHELEMFNHQLDDEKQNLANIKNRILALKSQVENLENNASKIVQYDMTQLKLELNHFMTGWLAYLTGAAKDQIEIDNTQRIFNQFLSTLGIQNQNN